jgi:hypothetical protein
LEHIRRGRILSTNDPPRETLGLIISRLKSERGARTVLCSSKSSRRACHCVKLFRADTQISAGQRLLGNRRGALWRPHQRLLLINPLSTNNPGSSHSEMVSSKPGYQHLPGRIESFRWLVRIAFSVEQLERTPDKAVKRFRITRIHKLIA